MGATEGPVGKLPSIFAGERDSLRDALIDNGTADFSESVDIRLTGAEVAPLHRVVKETPDAVAVVLIVLGGIDASLRRDGVSAARAVVEAEGLHLITKLGKSGGGRGAGEAGTDHNDLELTLICGADELRVILERGPLFLNWTFGDFGIKNHGGEVGGLVTKRAGWDRGRSFYNTEKYGRRDGGEAEENDPSH